MPDQILIEMIDNIRDELGRYHKAMYESDINGQIKSEEIIKNYFFHKFCQSQYSKIPATPEEAIEIGRLWESVRNIPYSGVAYYIVKNKYTGEILCTPSKSLSWEDWMYRCYHYNDVEKCWEDWICINEVADEK